MAYNLLQYMPDRRYLCLVGINYSLGQFDILRDRGSHSLYLITKLIVFHLRLQFSLYIPLVIQ